MTNIIKISREFKDNILGSIWLGVECTINEGDSVGEAFIRANAELKDAYELINGNNRINSQNGNYVDPMRMSAREISAALPTIQVSSSKDKATQSIKQEILNCRDVVTLKTFERIAKTEPELQEAYNQTMESLP